MYRKKEKTAVTAVTESTWRDDYLSDGNHKNPPFVPFSPQLAPSLFLVVALVLDTVTLYFPLSFDDP